MASTPLLGLSLPADGTTNWGTLVNTSITALLDSAVAGTTTLSIDADATLSDTTEAANQARQAIILWNATGTATRTITAPAKSKTYVVINATGGTQSIIFRGSTPTTGVTIPAGVAAMLAWNGSDFVTTGVTTVNLSSGVTGVLGTGNGGTGQSTYVNGQLLIGNSTGNTLTKANLTAGTGVSITNGAGSISIANTAPDQTVTLTGTGATTISGTYPTFTINSVNTTYSAATDSVLGLIKLGDAAVQSEAANAVTTTAARTYSIQINSAGQAVVNVPWVSGTANNPGGSNTQVQYNNAGAFGGSANFVFDGNQVGIGNASPAATLDVGGSAIIGSNSAASGITIFRRATIPTLNATFSSLTFASTTDGTTLQAGAAILARASEAWSGSGSGSKLVFRTSTNGVVGPSDKMTLENNGDLAVTGAISAAGAISGTSATFTRLVSGVGSVASAATITPTSDTVNQYNVTALAVPATIAAPSGTPADGQKLLIRLKDNGTARLLTWDAIYRVIGTTLPTTTVASKTTYVGCIYNTADAKWDVVAVTTQV